MRGGMRTWLRGRVRAAILSPVRANLTRSRRGRELVEAWEHHRADAYLLSFPKTGRTWLRLMIGKAIVEAYGLAVDNPMAINRMHRLDRRVPRIRVSHEDTREHVAAELERDKRRYAGKDVVFLVRDPRDVVVSMYFEASKRRDLATGTIGEFLRSPMTSLESIIAYYNAWAEARAIPRSFHLVTYEDLHREPAGEVDRVLRALRVEVGAPAIAAAVEYARFDNMRKLEATDAFRSRRLRPADASDAESFKTRKGRVKGYTEYLSPDEIAWIDERLARELSPLYAAYRRS